MTTYNGEEFVRDQIASILSQLGPDDELIISDDGSTDRTLEIIGAFGDPRIKLYRNTFRDLIRNFEFALSKARGGIIFLSDQDDIWYDRKVAECLDKLQDCDLVFSNLNVFGERITEGALMYDPQKDHNGFLNNYVKNKCVGATMAFRSWILDYALPFPAGIEMHDAWIFFLTTYYGKTTYIREPLVYYRRHGANASNTGGRTTNPLWKVIHIRLHWIYVLIARILKKGIRRR